MRFVIFHSYQASIYDIKVESDAYINTLFFLKGFTSAL